MAFPPRRPATRWHGLGWLEAPWKRSKESWRASRWLCEDGGEIPSLDKSGDKIRLTELRSAADARTWTSGREPKRKVRSPDETVRAFLLVLKLKLRFYS